MSQEFNNVASALFPAQGPRAVDVKFSASGAAGIVSSALTRQISVANEQIASGDATRIDDIDCDLTIS